MSATEDGKVLAIMAQADVAQLRGGVRRSAELARQAVHGVEEASKIFRSPELDLAAAGALVAAGESARALPLAEAAAKEQPLNDWFQSLELPAVRAEVELQHGNGERALELLDPARAYDSSNLPTNLLHARAYRQAKHYDDAVSALKHILVDLKYLDPASPVRALAQLELARAYADKGDKAAARTAYQDFLALWKDADPDIPLLKEAKAEYAKLQ